MAADGRLMYGLGSDAARHCLLHGLSQRVGSSRMSVNSGGMAAAGSLRM